MEARGVASLRQQLEQLFPGKWLSAGDALRVLRTGIAEIDSEGGRGLARRRISAWTGPVSSGKTTLLRSVVAYWCMSGLNVAYIDTCSRLIAFDWAFVDRGLCGAWPAGMITDGGRQGSFGQFMVLRLRGGGTGDTSVRREAFWAAEQLIASNIFDVVIFDLVTIPYLSDRIYARLQRALDRSRSALILLRDEDRGDPGQGQDPGRDHSHTRVGFKWSSNYARQDGLGGPVMILPGIQGFIEKEGLTRNMEIELVTNVTNRLFTHPQPPDRRTSKARARA